MRPTVLDCRCFGPGVSSVIAENHGTNDSDQQDCQCQADLCVAVHGDSSRTLEVLFLAVSGKTACANMGRESGPGGRNGRIAPFWAPSLVVAGDWHGWEKPGARRTCAGCGDCRECV